MDTEKLGKAATKVLSDAEKREWRREEANRDAAAVAARAKARQDAEDTERFWLKVRWHNQLSKNYEAAARRHEALCDSLLEKGIQ